MIGHMMLQIEKKPQKLRCTKLVQLQRNILMYRLTKVVIVPYIHVLWLSKSDLSKMKTNNSMDIMFLIFHQLMKIVLLKSFLGFFLYFKIFFYISRLFPGYLGTGYQANPYIPAYKHLTKNYYLYPDFIQLKPGSIGTWIISGTPQKKRSCPGYLMEIDMIHPYMVTNNSLLDNATNNLVGYVIQKIGFFTIFR